MSEKKFLETYFNDLIKLISFKEDEINKLQETKKILIETHKSKKIN